MSRSGLKEMIQRIGIRRAPQQDASAEKQQETREAQMQLAGFSDTFRKLSDSFEAEGSVRTELNQQEIQDIFEGVTEKVCKDCSRCSYCWQNVQEESCRLAYEIMCMCACRSDIEKSDLPPMFRQRCVRSDNFVAETRRLTDMAKINLLWENRMAESRLAVAGQFEEIASVIGSFSEQMGNSDGGQTMQVQTFKQVLQQEGLKLRRVILSKKPDGRRYIRMALKSTTENRIDVGYVAQAISRICGMTFLPSESTHATVGQRWMQTEYLEDTRYNVIFGKARMIKHGEEVSGDCYTFLTPDNGQVLLTLSDGMGSGPRAYRESDRIVGMIEQMIDTGFSREATIRLIHAMMLPDRDKWDGYATIDMCMLDLYDGGCEFIKLGAAPSFIIRGNNTELIVSSALPPGTMLRPEYDRASCRLSDGQMVVMVSDGVLNSLGSTDNEEKFMAFLNTLKEPSPQAVAGSILNYALACSKYQAEDDMTVLVCGLYGKKGPEGE